MGASSTTVLCRQAHWPISRYPIGSTHFTRLFHSRLGTAMLPPFYTASVAERVRSTLLK